MILLYKKQNKETNRNGNAAASDLNSLFVFWESHGKRERHEHAVMHAIAWNGKAGEKHQTKK